MSVFFQIKTFIPLVLLSCAVLSSAAPLYAVPIDDFSAVLDLATASGGQVSKSVQSPGSLGGSVGALLNVTGEGDALVIVHTNASKSGKTKLTFKGDAKGATLRLTWDADRNPRTTSAAGLACIDLTHDGSAAFVLSGLSLGEDELDSKQTVHFNFEIRTYDGQDPSGQSYSTAVVKRYISPGEKTLSIPFSAFTKPGPNGTWNPSCLGAIELTIQSLVSDFLLSFENFRTDGGCLTPEDKKCPLQIRHTVIEQISPLVRATATLVGKPLNLVTPIPTIPLATPLRSPTPLPTEIPPTLQPLPTVTPSVTPTKYIKPTLSPTSTPRATKTPRIFKRSEPNPIIPQ